MDPDLVRQQEEAERESLLASAKPAQAGLPLAAVATEMRPFEKVLPSTPAPQRLPRAPASDSVRPRSRIVAGLFRLSIWAAAGLSMGAAIGFALHHWPHR